MKNNFVSFSDSSTSRLFFASMSLLFMFSIALHNMYAAPLPTPNNDINNALVTFVVIGGAIGGSVLLGRGACQLYAWKAHYRFKDALALQERLQDAKALWAKLQEQISQEHIRFYSHGTFRNYHLLRWEHDLTWYINRLTFYSYFYVCSESRASMLSLIDSLKELCALVHRDPKFITQRREFEQHFGFEA